MKKTTPTVPERVVRRMIHHVARIELTTRDGKRYIASAYPLSWSPIVEATRNRLFTEATADGHELTMAAATALADKAVETPFARTEGATIYEALHALEIAVREQVKEWAA